MNEHNENQNLQVPAKLAEALQNFQKERVFVPGQVDEKILTQAREHLCKEKRRIVSLSGWAAMAASLAVIGGFIYFSQTRNQNYAAEDINRDGSVDILDAFALARRIEAGETSVSDLNHDGAIDQRDIELITSGVVRLDKGGRS